VEWFRNVVLFAAAIGFAQWITPGGTFEKYIRFIVSLLTLAVILSPLMSEKEIAVSSSVSLRDAFAAERWQQETADIEAVQQLQIREILVQRIAQEAQILLESDFPGITGENIEVYIQQESLKNGSSVPCLVVIRTEETHRAEEIRQQLQSGLRLPRACIQIEGKEVANE